jgi:vacuolar-type H+-ATPase subunit H
MSIEALDRIRAVEQEADEIVRKAHDEAKARMARAELDGRRVVQQAEEKARMEAEEISSASRARIEAEACEARKVIAQRVDGVNSTAKANWEKAMEIAVRKVLNSFGDL